MDTGSLKKAPAETIRILIWLLSFLSFGYATQEFEVTSERLGVYRPEEHIDNPKNYNDDQDARVYDQRLRGPVRDIELQIDPETGMKNYIANERGDWATSAAFVKYSIERSIHHGRLYCNGHGFFKGKDEDLAEALRLLGQANHCLEDFPAHSNFVELTFREMGFHTVFPHVGTNTQINLRGKHVFPIVTGTFGMVDFLHSVLGEATDHFTQSEVNEMDNALGTAQSAAKSSSPVGTLIKLLANVPGTKELCTEAEDLQRRSDARERQNIESGPSWGSSRGFDGQQPQYESSRGAPEWNQFPGQQYHGAQYDHSQQSQNWQQPPPQYGQPSWDAQGGYSQGPPPQQPPQWNQGPHDQGVYQQPPQQLNQPPGDFNQQQNFQPAPPQAQPAQQGSEKLPGMPDIDPAKVISDIYPILAFRDKVVRTISKIIEKIPGLEALVDKITETLTVFIFSLLAPFVRPLIKAVQTSLQTGSSTVIDSSAKHQYEPWTDPNCSDPTHSFLSKDHFSNILNEVAGGVAAEIIKYAAPRVLYAWQDTSIPVERVLDDIMKVFHHPALRDDGIEVHRMMFQAVKRWVDADASRSHIISDVLSSDGVRNGKNQKATEGNAGHSHNQMPSSVAGFGNMGLPFGGSSGQQHSQSQPGGWSIPGFGAQQQHNQQNASSFGNPLEKLSRLPIPGLSNVNSEINRLEHKVGKFTSIIPGFGSSGGKREIDESDTSQVPPQGTAYNQGYGEQNPGQYPPQGGYQGYGEGASGSGYYGAPSGGQADSYYRG